MRPLRELFDECDRHLQALEEAMRRCPRPLTPAHFAIRDPDLLILTLRIAFAMVAEMTAMIAALKKAAGSGDRHGRAP